MLNLLLLLLSTIALADEQLKVVVMDTGLNLEDNRFKPYLCETGHQDFTGEGIKDYNGHGTHVVGNIIRNSGHLGFCLIIIKSFGWKMDTIAYESSFAALQQLNPQFVNISGGGKKSVLPEKLVIFKMKSTKFIVAAGNNGKNLALDKYYPAAYPFKNVIAIGNLNPDGTPNPLSNYGPQIDAWEIGTDIISECKDSGSDCVMSGTSMATSTHTGKLIKEYVKTH